MIKDNLRAGYRWWTAQFRSNIATPVGWLICRPRNPESVFRTKWMRPVGVLAGAVALPVGIYVAVLDGVTAAVATTGAIVRELAARPAPEWMHGLPVIELAARGWNHIGAKRRMAVATGLTWTAMMGGAIAGGFASSAAAFGWGPGLIGALVVITAANQAFPAITAQVAAVRRARAAGHANPWRMAGGDVELSGRSIEAASPERAAAAPAVAEPVPSVSEPAPGPARPKFGQRVAGFVPRALATPPKVAPPARHVTPRGSWTDGIG